MVSIVPLKVTAALSALIKAPDRTNSSRGGRETEPSLLIVILLKLKQGLKCTNLRLVFLWVSLIRKGGTMRTYGRRPTANRFVI